jgi:hypothetical protein
VSGDLEYFFSQHSSGLPINDHWSLWFHWQLKERAEQLVKDRITAVPRQVWPERDYNMTDEDRLIKHKVI